MNLRTYRMWRLVFIAVVGIIAAVSVILGNLYFLIGAEVVGVVAIVLIRRRVKEIVHDERTYAVAYKAARLTFALAGLAMAITGGILVALHRHELSTTPALVGITLLYATCGMLVINLASHYYYSWKLGGRNE
jgi:uncharacterized membrane protein